MGGARCRDPALCVYRLALHTGAKPCVACWQLRECELVSKELGGLFGEWLRETIKPDI